MTEETRQGVHPTSLKGYGAGKSEFYNRIRPSYHPTVLSYIRETIKKPGPLSIVDIGAGSGIFTRNMLSHPSWNSSIAEIRAVEPNEGMRTVFEQTINDERVTISDGVFEKTGVEDGWADVITMASAFHWCLNHTDALEEFKRILKPDGVVVCVWYEGDADASSFADKLWNLGDHLPGVDVQRVRHDSYYRAKWRDAFTLPAYLSNFTSTPEEELIRFTQSYTTQSWLDFVMTWSWVAVLTEEEVEKAKAVVRGMIENGEKEGMVWEDKEKGVWKFPYRSRVVVFRRKEA